MVGIPSDSGVEAWRLVLVLSISYHSSRPQSSIACCAQQFLMEAGNRSRPQARNFRVHGRSSKSERSCPICLVFALLQTWKQPIYQARLETYSGYNGYPKNSVVHDGMPVVVGYPIRYDTWVCSISHATSKESSNVWTGFRSYSTFARTHNQSESR